MKIFVKIVVEDENGKDKIVPKFSAEATRSAILLAMVRAVEDGKSPLSAIPGRETPKKTVNDTPQEVDVFTAEALAKIPPGKPDHNSLKQPTKIEVGDRVIDKEGKTYIISDGFPRTEGHEWTDEAGRRWKIVDGKKRQQKKVRVA